MIDYSEITVMYVQCDYPLCRSTIEHSFDEVVREYSIYDKLDSSGWSTDDNYKAYCPEHTVLFKCSKDKCRAEFHGSEIQAEGWLHFTSASGTGTLMLCPKHADEYHLVRS